MSITVETFRTMILFFDSLEGRSLQATVNTALHKEVITDPKDSKKMADAFTPEKQLAFLKQRNHILSFLRYLIIL